MIDLNGAPRQDTPLFEDAETRKARIEEALKRDIRRVVKSLYPRAEISQRDARVGDIGGNAGHSLSIALTPAEAGMWIDHATDERGDIFTLVQRALGLVTFSDALTEAEALVGGTSTPRQTVHVERQAKLPAKPPRELVNQIDHVYRDKEGKRIATVSRKEFNDGSKSFPVQRASDAEWTFPSVRTLYRLEEWHDLSDVVFVEGEKCADALRAQGIPATSMMGGANALLEKTDFSPLAGKRVILWPDNDVPGFKLMERVRPHLDAIGCIVSIVSIPAGKPDKWDSADAVASGEDVKAYLNTLETAPRRTLPIMSIADLAGMRPPNWLIDSLLVENGMSALYAPSETFKSFMALDIALSIATGQDWRGRPTVSGPVVYMIGEGVAGWPARVFTWLQRRAPDAADTPFWTIPTSVALTEKDDATMLLETIQSACERPALIIIDTLARNFGAGDENSTQDMNAFVASIDRLREATGAHVMLVHHTGKDADKGGRGSSVLRAALDTEMQCHRPNMDGPMIQFKVTKQKDIEKADPMAFEMVSVEGIHPQTGEVITSLVPVLRDASEMTPVAPEPVTAKDFIQSEIVDLLADRGAMSVYQIAEILDKSRQYTDRNLKTLLSEKIVDREIRGKTAFWFICNQPATNKTEQ